jgi:hypothetical protein
MGKIRFPLFEKEGPGRFAQSPTVHIAKKISLNPPLPKGDFCSRLYILNCDTVSTGERGEPGRYEIH